MDAEHPIDDHPSCHFTIRHEGEESHLWLSGLWGSPHVELEREVPDGAIVEFACPHCRETLEASILCPSCEAPLLALRLTGGGAASICSRRGCPEHLLDLEGTTDLKNHLDSLTASGRPPGKPTLVLCAGTAGQASGANDVLRVAKRYILENGLHDRIELRITGCQGFCEMDPFVVIEPGRNLYPKIGMDDVGRIIDAALEGNVVEDLLYREPGEEKLYENKEEIPFFRDQVRTILGRNEDLDPLRISDYFRQGGYSSLAAVIERNDPEWIVDEVVKAGLRGWPATTGTARGRPTWSATPMREIPALSWTAPSSRGTPTWS